jgi:hypothetical protein
MPKVYLRTKINTKTQTSVRDVVDGQQRLRAIIDFANNELALNHRSREFKGKRYRDLDPELQQAFLGYQISVEHLINASDKVVLEVFSRLNSYTVTLSPAELRHATYDTELKWFIYWLTNELRWFLERYMIFSPRTMIRMDDDAFFAELVNLLVNGIVDGGAAALDTLYKKNQEEFPQEEEFSTIIKEAIDWMDKTLPSLLTDSPLGRPYQVQILFAAYVHQEHGLPPGRMKEMPERHGIGHSETIIERLSALAEAIDTEDLGGPHKAFVEASSGATIRFKSRSARFLAFNRAIAAR